MDVMDVMDDKSGSDGIAWKLNSFQWDRVRALAVMRDDNFPRQYRLDYYASYCVRYGSAEHNTMPQAQQAAEKEYLALPEDHRRLVDAVIKRNDRLRQRGVDIASHIMVR